LKTLFHTHILLESKTEQGYDYVRFYKDSSHNDYFGESKYSGGQGGSQRNFPGIDGQPPLIINATSFVFHFHSDGSRNDWGYRIDVKPRFGEEDVNEAMKQIGVLARLHKNLLSLASFNPRMRAIDESLILYIETEKKGRISRIEDLSQMSWSSLVQSDTSADITGYTPLIAAVSDESAVADTGTITVDDIEVSDLPAEDQGPLSFLFESFPETNRLLIIETFNTCDKNVEETVTILQDTSTTPQQKPGATALATSRLLAERYKFVKQFNEDFKTCYDLINFRQVDKFYSIANLLSRHRTYLLYIVKVKLFLVL
jgi:hypothetical protein